MTNGFFSKQFENNGNSFFSKTEDIEDRNNILDTSYKEKMFSF